jgi:GT2 family glycosyltransferase
MNATHRLISVIIPSRNAPSSLTHLLEGLAHQTLSPDQYEVLVVGGVEERVIRRRVPPGLPYPLHVIVKPGPGASRRRNAGAEQARADLLVFLDDDMGPEPGLLEAHYRAHQGSDGKRVVMGYLPPIDVPSADGRPADWLKAALRDWWEEGFEAMVEPGHRFCYTDVLSGNLSLSASLFRQVGGFDPDYYPCRDDFELGVRLLQAGAELALCLEARSWHHDKTDLPRLLQRKTDEGRTDVQLARQYPELRPALLIARQFAGLGVGSRILRLVTRHWPAAADLAAQWLIRAVGLCERWRLRNTWRWLVSGLLVYAYWRGILNATADWNEVRSLTTAPVPPLVNVDLAAGIACVAQMLHRSAAPGVRLTWRGIPLGRIDPQPGAEAVRGRHVKAWLREQGALMVVRAQTLDKLLANGGDAPSALVHDDSLLGYPDLCAPPLCRKPGSNGNSAAFRPSLIAEVDLAQGVDALGLLQAPYRQLVLVRQHGRAIGWLSLEERTHPRTIGEVMYAILAQLDHDTLIIP